jgi:hypothetical protein
MRKTPPNGHVWRAQARPPFRSEKPQGSRGERQPARRQTFSEQTTQGGYLCGEVASALQKEIRRGNEREALFWASELDLAGYGNYVWKRLRIIASEDVGLASTETVIAVRVLYENWLELRKTVKDERHQGFVRVFLLYGSACLPGRPSRACSTTR